MTHDREKHEPPSAERRPVEDRLEHALRSFRAAPDVEVLARNVLTEVASVVPVVQAALYVIDSEGTSEARGRAPRLRLAASYAATGEVKKSFALGEGLVGQCALERRKLCVSAVPPEHFRVRSGLGASAPRELTLLPVPGARQVAAVLELATFEPITSFDAGFLARLAAGLTPIFDELPPSSLRDEAPSSRRPAGARQSLVREASRHKPELFARMGHELRTPLNSLLVLSQMLAENAEQNLTVKQMTFAKAINASGKELLSLINELLELAKSESSSLGGLCSPAVHRPPEVGEGSSPVAPTAPAKDEGAASGAGIAERESVLRADQRVVLMVEGDAELEDAARRSAGARGYTLVTTTNIISDMAAPVEAMPAAVLIDLRSKELDGWILLDRLRQEPGTRHIPIAALVPKERAPTARRMGAAALLEQPSPAHLDAALTELELYAPERERRVLLVHSRATPVEKDLVNPLTVVGVSARVTHSAEEGLAALRAERFHACVWSVGAEPAELTSLGALPASNQTPIIVYTAHPFKPVPMEQRPECSGQLTLKSAASIERLLHELSFHLHRPEAAYSTSQRHALGRAALRSPELVGLRVLLIDADVRNVFAMTSALERHGVLVSYADSVQGGLSLLEREQGIAALLADAGLALANDHELLRYVRRARHPALPFIVLASEPRAVQREQCMRSGASHYTAKPIAARHLISVLRVASADGLERGLVVCR